MGRAGFGFGFGRMAHRARGYSDGWAPVLTANISDDGSRTFTRSGADSWDQGVRSSIAYGGDVGIKTLFNGQWDTVIGLATTPVSAAFYSCDVGSCYINPTSFRPQRAGAAIVGSVDSPVLVAATSYLGVRRVGAAIEFFHSLDGTGGDEAVLFSDADPSVGAPLYLVVGAVWSGFSVGPVERI